MNSVRETGRSLVAISASGFVHPVLLAKRCMAVLPPGLALALGPEFLEQIAAMTVKIQQYDRTIKRRGVTRQPASSAVRSR